MSLQYLHKGLHVLVATIPEKVVEKVVGSFFVARHLREQHERRRKVVVVTGKKLAAEAKFIVEGECFKQSFSGTAGSSLPFSLTESYSRCSRVCFVDKFRFDRLLLLDFQIDRLRNRLQIRLHYGFYRRFFIFVRNNRLINLRLGYFHSYRGCKIAKRFVAANICPHKGGIALEFFSQHRTRIIAMALFQYSQEPFNLYVQTYKSVYFGHLSIFAK